MTIQRITSKSRVLSLYEHQVRRHTVGVGEKAQFVEVSEGWWARIEGSSALYLGPERPVGLIEGQTITVALEWEDGR